jgi:DNA-directed RNA polymerase specialized sigma24 family protein
VAGWPTIDRADDQWLVQALRSGDTAADVRFYDLYAARLFDYCHVLLRDEEAAGRALVDALIVTRERIGDLRDAQEFRGRLYAVTRDECLRRRSSASSASSAARRRAAEAGGEADEATRQLVHSALLVLTGRQREALDLSLRHELAAQELAETLAVAPQDATILITQARHDLDDAFAAVVVSVTGRQDCPSVSALAGPPGARIDAETCGRLTRHITNCPICGARGDRRIETARLLSAMPFAAVPAALRDRYLSAAADPGYARSTMAHRVRPPAEPVAVEPRRRHLSRAWPVTAGVALGVLAIGGVLYVLPDSGHQNAGNDQAIASHPGDSPSDGPSTPDSGGPLPKDGATSASPSPSDTSKTPTPTPTPSGSVSQSPAAQPTSPSAAAPPPPQAPPAPGTLAVYGCTMRGSRHCTVTVVAQGGPVNWSVTGSSGGVSAHGGGSLSAGQSAGVDVTRNSSWCIGSGSGSVSFSSGATAGVRWYC